MASSTRAPSEPATSAFDSPTVAAMRRKRGAKWTRYGDRVIPCFVADMDFPLATPIVAALERALEVGDFGYSRRLGEGNLPEIFAAWADRRFGWSVDPGRVVGLADVVQGIYIAVDVFTEPGDGVVTLTPVYPPFLRAVEEAGRRLVDCTLASRGARYEIDFERLEAKIDERTRLMLLCNPHNPTGRAFSRGELERIAQIAVRHDLVVLADEIHADLVYAPHQHVPFSTLGPEVAVRTLTMTSGTKSFNIAGLRFALTVFGSAALQERFARVPERVRGGLNCLGVYASEAAWTECDAWLDELVAYLAGNRDFVQSFVEERMPGITMHRPEATFLAWLDCRELVLPESPFDYFLQRAEVALSDGRDFGSGGDGFVRLNYATSRAILGEALDRMAAALPG